MSGPSFTYVYVPADEKQPIEERSITLNTTAVDEAVSAMTDMAKKHFTVRPGLLPLCRVRCAGR